MRHNHRHHHCHGNHDSAHFLDQSPFHKSILWQIQLLAKHLGAVFMRNDMSRQIPPIVLFLLVDNDERIQMDQKELADRLRVTPATMTGIIKRLKRDGLIAKREDPNDLRRNLIELTDDGLSCVNRYKSRFWEVEELVMNGFSEEEIGIISSYLKRMSLSLDAYIENSSSY